MATSVVGSSTSGGVSGGMVGEDEKRRGDDPSVVERIETAAQRSDIKIDVPELARIFIERLQNLRLPDVAEPRVARVQAIGFLRTIEHGLVHHGQPQISDCLGRLYGFFVSEAKPFANADDAKEAGSILAQACASGLTSSDVELCSLTDLNYVLRLTTRATPSRERT